MHWLLTNRADPRAALIADRHYSRKSPGTPQFAPPGRCIVLVTPDYSALWVSSHQRVEYVSRTWATDAWVCTLFRNESEILSSILVLEAVAATRYIWKDVPESGIVTIIDTQKVRKKRDFGRCFRRAGFTELCYVGNGHLLVLQLLPNQMPQAVQPMLLQPILL